MKRNLFSLLIIAFLASCTSTINLPVLKPADITLPSDIEKFTLVNRSKPSKNNQVWNVVEAVLTGEGLFADREGADQCLSGLMATMQQTPRFNITQTSIEFKGTGTEQFALPLSWPEVENICRQNTSEAIIVLEAFDSDSKLTNEAKPVQKKGADGQTITFSEFYSHARMEVKSGWRIYFPKDKRILDEYRFSDFLTFDGKGETAEKANASLPNKRDCIKRTGFHAGQQYGYRISPQWINVSRYFYTRGNDPMKAAGKRVKRAGDWKGAMEIWKKEALNNNPKVAWKANYNMALACEHEGNLDIALEWAKKSFDIGQKQAPAQYIHTLNTRINEKKKLDEQMKNQK